MFLFKLFLAVVFTEALTEIITKSELFRPLRAKVFILGDRINLFKWFHNLLDCGYCFSVWVGCATAFLLFKDTYFLNPFVDWFLIGIFIHRLSNILHNSIDILHNGF